MYSIEEHQSGTGLNLHRVMKDQVVVALVPVVTKTAVLFNDQRLDPKRLKSCSNR